MTGTDRTPSVSVVLPTLNEQRYLRDCLDTLVAQDYPALQEVLVVDGGSSDCTREIATAFAPLVRVVDNPRVTAAAALNVGLREARGDVICRADAHSLYASDYVRRNVEVLLETAAANVGGRMQAVGTTAFGRAVAAVTSSPLGIGPAKFHYLDRRADVDTVYLGTWQRDTLEQVGGWDETTLQWAAEDHELNHRLRKRGGRIVLDPSISSVYFPRDSWRALWRQYLNYGMGKASTLAKHRDLPTWRPLAPAALVASSLVALLLGKGVARVLPAGVHLLVCAVGGARVARDPGVAPHHAILAVETCHWAYGLGFWRGVFRAALGIPFTSRPKGHR